jgi:hypothetical protein
MAALQIGDGEEFFSLALALRPRNNSGGLRKPPRNVMPELQTHEEKPYNWDDSSITPADE